MRTRTCMCGAKVSKSHAWDHDLDQCMKCTRTVTERIRMDEYLEGFKVGDLFACRGMTCILLKKIPTDSYDSQVWYIHEVQTGRKKNLWVSNWLVCGDLRQLRENIHPLNGEDDEC